MSFAPAHRSVTVAARFGTAPHGVVFFCANSLILRNYDFRKAGSKTVFYLTWARRTTRKALITGSGLRGPRAQLTNTRGRWSRVSAQR